MLGAGGRGGGGGGGGGGSKWEGVDGGTWALRIEEGRGPARMQEYTQPLERKWSYSSERGGDPAPAPILCL